MTDFTLPELGENISSGDVLRVLVRPGDALAKDQAVLELETDKATIEVPSSVAGRVREIKVKAGDKVSVGQAILSVDDLGGAQPQTSSPAGAASGQPPAAQGAATPGPDERPAEGSPVPPEGAESPAGAADLVPPRGQKVVDITRGSRATAESSTPPEMPPAPAAPSVRRMARELGVDINLVPGTGAGGRISTDDVKAHVSRLIGAAAPSGAPAAAEPLPDFTRWGEIDRQPMRAVRRKTAAHLSYAWATIPHVTQHDAADMTALEDLRARYGPSVEAAGGSLTVTAILVKIAAAALKKFPQFNASVDTAAEEIIYKKYVHVGIAVDTDRGLLVPVIRDADRLTITSIAVALAQLSRKARDRKLTLDEMQGGTFSISNLGGLGGTAFTPIINAPEVAILGVSRGRTEPVWLDGQFVPRLMLPLSLSYDHRVIDGADGVRFLRWVVEALEQPFLLALQG